MAEARLRPDQIPDDEGRDRHQHHRRHEPAGYAVGDCLNRRAAALRLCHHRDDAGQHGVRADRLCFHDQAAGAVDCAARDRRAGKLEHRRRLAGEHRFIDRRVAVAHDAVDRDRLAGAHAQAVASRNVCQRHFAFGAVGADAPCRLGREFEQCTDGASRGGPCAQLQHLAEQDERNDDARSLIIDWNHIAMRAESGREEAGGDCSDQTVEERCPHADRDQREHIIVAALQRGPSAFEKRPSGPQHDRRGEGELHPGGPTHGHEVQPHHLATHGKQQQRHREDPTHPEAAGKVDQFGVRPLVGARLSGLQRHAADRAGAGGIATDLRMHRAGPDPGCRCHRSGCRLRRQIFCGIGDELRPAVGAAEVIGSAIVLGMLVRLPRIDAHSADGILGFARGFAVREAMAAMAMMIMHRLAPLRL